MTLTTGIIYYLMARTDKINGLLETMENSTNLLLIPIALIVIAFVCRWYTAFVESQIESRDRRLREVKIVWLRRCYAVDKEELDRIRYKQIMDDKYYE
jgi:hypothetical protein